YYGVGADREGANTDDGGWGGVEAETAWRELVEPAQVFHDRDASRQQRGVHRACRAAGVVDVDRVDANQCGLPLDQPVRGGSGEEGVLVPDTVGAPVTVPAGVGTPPVLGLGSRRAHGDKYPVAWPPGPVPAGPGGGLDTVGGVFQAPPRRLEADAVDFADETCRCHWAGRLVIVGLTGAVLAGGGPRARRAARSRAR